MPVVTPSESKLACTYFTVQYILLPGWGPMGHVAQQVTRERAQNDTVKHKNALGSMQEGFQVQTRCLATICKVKVRKWQVAILVWVISHRNGRRQPQSVELCISTTILCLNDHSILTYQYHNAFGIL